MPTTSYSAQWLVQQANLPLLTQVLPAHTLYLALRSQDIEENLALVEWVRGSQLQKIFDFDVWEFDSSFNTLDISAPTVMAWIQSWLMFGKPFTAERFFDLEEETVLLILTKFFTILPDGIGTITDEIREDWLCTPDKRFFLQPISSDPEDFEILTQFIDAIYGFDMKRAGEIFAEAALFVRQETLELAQKWRLGRLADQGFVDKDEAIASLFHKKTLPTKIAKFKSVCNNDFFVEEASENLVKLFSSLDTEDSELNLNEIEALVKKTQIFLVESLWKTPQLQPQLEAPIQPLNTDLPSQNTELLIEKTLNAFFAKNDALFFYLKQKIVYISNTVASATSEHNAHHNTVVQTAVSIVRGCLNVGLEFCLENGDLYNLKFQTGTDIQNAMHCIEQLGVDYIFKIGLNSVLDMQKNLLNFLFESKLINSKKVAHAQRWLHSENFHYSTELFLALDGLLKAIPVCHTETLAEHSPSTKTPIYLSQKFKSFEHKSEIVFAQRFIQNIQFNLN